MRKRTSHISTSDTEEERASSGKVLREDIHLLRRPLQTALTGFQEAKNAYENGTNEVRRLLFQECSLIYECNVCRNLFRSFANFISHKRVFCCATSNAGYSNGFRDQNSTVSLVKSEKPSAKKRCRSTGASPVPDTSNNCDVNSVIERLKCDQLPESIATELANTVLQLEHMPNSDQVLHQSLKRQGNGGIKTEVDEVHKLLTNLQTVLGPDGKPIANNIAYASVVEKQNNASVDEKSIAKQLAGDIICEICKISFQTQKMLKSHLQRKHIASTFVFQCPACSLTFLQPAAVIRHLANEHNKPLRRIRMMRETIVKRRLQQGDVHIKGEDRDSTMLLQSDAENANKNNEQAQKRLSKCIYCDRSFERRAALSTHLISCRAKLVDLAKVEAPPLRRQKSRTHEQMTVLHTENETAALAHTSPPAPVDAITKALNDSEQTIVKEEATVGDADALNEMFANLGNQTFGAGLHTVSLDKLDLLDSESTNASATVDEGKIDLKNATEIEAAEPQIFAAAEMEEQSLALTELKPQTQRRFRIVHAPSKHLSCRCKICNKQFNALSNLRRHISMFHYRRRKFGCKLCEYRAFRRYDIVNHLGFVHKMTGERETMSTEYVAVHEVHYSKEDVDGDILLITDEKETRSIADESSPKTYEKRTKRNKTLISGTTDAFANATPTTPANLNNVSNVSSSSAEITTDISLCKPRRQRLKRSLADSALKALQKRPIRNRIKPVNKDFVYDLSNLLNQAQQADNATAAVVGGVVEAVRQSRRRNTLYSLTNDNILSGNAEQKLVAPLLIATRESIKGAARRISLQLVNQGLAASSTLPEIPAERPQMRPRLTSTHRGDMQAGRVIETCDLEAARLKSTLLDDTFLEKIAKHSAGGFKIKPCLALQHNSEALNTLLQKVDLSMHNQQQQEQQQQQQDEQQQQQQQQPEQQQQQAHVVLVDIASMHTMPNVALEDVVHDVPFLAAAAPATATRVDIALHTTYHNAAAVAATADEALMQPSASPPRLLMTNTNGKHFTEPVPSIPETTSPPPTPKKRITLMQRLAENKAKRRESLLCTSFEN